MKESQQLRCIALKLGVSGTALPIAETRLYKGSYGFVKLQVYVPKTQNTTNAPLCTAFCTTTDELGKEKISTRNYNLMYVGEFDLEGKNYLLFESLLPKEFTKKSTSPNGLKITLNYFDTEITTDAHGEVILEESGVPKRHATDLLVSSTYTTTVYPGGWNEENIDLNINAAEVGQIVANMHDIADIQSQMDDIKKIADGTHADSSEALEKAKQAKEIADGLNDKIDEANKTAEESNKTAQEAEKIAGDAQAVSASALETAGEAKETADGLAGSIAQANQTAGEAKETAQEARDATDDLAEIIDGVRENVESIESYIPSATNAENQLTDKAFVNSSINNMAAFYITSSAQGNAFPTHAALIDETTFYSGGKARVPTQNDYATVLADETQPKGVDGSYPTTRYVYQTNEVGGTYPNGQWAFQYVVNNTSLTQAQVDAINSGITKEIVDQIGKGNVTGVKGNSESTYRTGNVNITAGNVGAVNKSGDTMTGDLVTPLILSNGFKQRDDSKNYVDLVDGEGGNFGVAGNAGNIYRLQNMLKFLGSEINANTQFNNTHLAQCYNADNGAPTNNGHWIVGAQSSSDYGAQFALSDNGNAYYRKLSAGVWSSWEIFLKLDPTKLSPTTANGWTVGGWNLKIPSAGIYLVAINETVAPCPVVASDPNGYLSFPFPILNLDCLVVCNNGWDIYYQGEVLDIVDVESVAYKKIA